MGMLILQCYKMITLKRFPLKVKLFLLLQPVLLLLATACFFHAWFMSYKPEVDWLASSLMSLFYLYGILMMISLGTFLRSTWWRLIYIGLGLWFLSLLFKLQHWQGARALSLLSAALVALPYLAFFISKKNKSLLDWLKLIYALGFLAGTVSTLNRFAYTEFIVPVSAFLGFATILVFYIGLIRDVMRPPDPRAELADDGVSVFRYHD